MVFIRNPNTHLHIVTGQSLDWTLVFSSTMVLKQLPGELPHSLLRIRRVAKCNDLATFL